MSVDGQDSNAMIAAVQPVGRTRRSSSVRRIADPGDRAWAFSDLLTPAMIDENSLPEVFRGLPALQKKLSLNPTLYMQQLYGRDFDPVTGRVNHEGFLTRTQEKTARLATDLETAMRSIDADDGAAVFLSVDDSGQVKAATDHPDGEKISTLMHEDDDLSQAFRDVVQAHHWAALTEVGVSYVQAWYGTGDEDVREAIADQFRHIFDDLAESASTMVFKGAALESVSVATALKAIETMSATS